jgi:multidrug resistance efflux pump
MRWYTLEVPAVVVPETFSVALSFDPHRTKGIYLGLDKNVEESHSYRGLPQLGFSAVDEKSDWMVRVFLVSDGDGVHHEAYNDVPLRYAEAALEVAHAEVREAEKANRRYPGTVPPSELKRKKLCVELALLDVERAAAVLAGDKQVIKEVEVRRAKAAADVAEAEVEQAREANQRHPGTVPASELWRKELRLQQARLQLQEAKAVLAGDEQALKEVDIRYAKAAADVAQAEVELSREANRRYPGTVPPGELNRKVLTLQLALLDVERAEAVLAGDEQALKEVEVRRAKAAADVAEAEVQQAREANRRFPGTVPPSELNRKILRRQQALLEVEGAEAVLAGDEQAAPEHKR